MAGFVIHLAIAQEYLNKYNVENKEEFLKGAIAPDLIKEEKAHYGEYSSSPNLDNFIDEKGIKTSYNRGYFLHLLTDYLFYNKYVDSFSKEIYDDYNFLNRELIERYKVNIPDEIKNTVLFREGTPKILDKEALESFITAVSVIDLDKLVNKEIDLNEIGIKKNKRNTQRFSNKSKRDCQER